MPPVYFLVNDDTPDSGRYVGTEHTGGPWDPRLEHGGPPSALLVRAAERLAAAEGVPGLVAVRFAAEFVGPVPVAELDVTARIVRAARSAVLVAATLSAGGRLCLDARIWLIRAGDTSSVAPARTRIAEPSADLPGLGGSFPYADSIEWRAESGSLRSPGPGIVWSRPRLRIVDGEELTGLQRVCLVGDSASGISAELDWDEWTFLNVDLDVHLARPVSGDWVRMDAVTQLGTHGSALARSTVSDLDGVVGCTAQTLVVARRRVPAAPS